MTLWMLWETSSGTEEGRVEDLLDRRLVAPAARREYRSRRPDCRTHRRARCVEAPVRHPSNQAQSPVSSTALISSRLRMIAVPVRRAVACAAVTVALPIGLRDQAPWAA
jgi:hypothetical protein